MLCHAVLAVLYFREEGGRLLEPYEELVVEVAEELAGPVIEALSARRCVCVWVGGGVQMCLCVPVRAFKCVCACLCMRYLCVPVRACMWV